MKLVTSFRQIINIIKRSGPRIDPCGTPQVIGLRSQFTLLIETDCFLFER